MNLYLDCEWNEYKGELISIALVSKEGHEFYEVVGCILPKSWVAQNVMPKLVKAPIGYLDVQKKLGIFLDQFDSVNIVADWPEDISHFCNLLIVGSGYKLNTPKLSFDIVSVATMSKNPHNALADAIALMEAS